MDSAKKIPFIFRVTRSNRFTIPVLLHTLEKDRWDKVFDLKTADTFRDLVRAAEEKRALIAYSFMTPHLPDVWREIRRLKKTCKTGSLLIAGGPHPTGDPDGTLEMGFDAAISGDGETGLPLFIRTFLDGTDLHRRIFSAPNLSSLDESFPISRYDSLVPPLEITRGCFYGCSFCQTRGRKPVHRSLESIERFLDELARKGFLFRAGFICPSGFEYGSEKAGAPSNGKIEALLSSSKSRGIRFLEYAIFPSEVRPNTVSHDLLKCVRKYCSNKKITLGAQSASDRILKEEKRGHTFEAIERAAALIHEHGFRPQIDFIMGFPEETEADRMETLRRMKHLGLRYRAWNQVHYFLPLAGTPQYRRSPSPLSDRTIRILDGYAQNGYANNWWRQGLETAQRLARIQKELLESGSIR